MLTPFLKFENLKFFFFLLQKSIPPTSTNLRCMMSSLVSYRRGSRSRIALSTSLINLSSRIVIIFVYELLDKKTQNPIPTPAPVTAPAIKKDTKPLQMS